MVKNIGKNISKNFSTKFSQKLFDHAKQSATDAFKSPSKRAIQTTVQATDDLLCSKSADKITKVSKNLQQKNSETVTRESFKEIPEERYVSPEERQEVID